MKAGVQSAHQQAYPDRSRLGLDLSRELWPLASRVLPPLLPARADRGAAFFLTSSSSRSRARVMRSNSPRGYLAPTRFAAGQSRRDSRWADHSGNLGVMRRLLEMQCFRPRASEIAVSSRCRPGRFRCSASGAQALDPRAERFRDLATARGVSGYVALALVSATPSPNLWQAFYDAASPCRARRDAGPRSPLPPWSGPILARTPPTWHLRRSSIRRSPWGRGGGGARAVRTLTSRLGLGSTRRRRGVTARNRLSPRALGVLPRDAAGSAARLATSLHCLTESRLP